MASDILSQSTDALHAVGAALSYTWGQCTRWVAENVSWIPGGLGNANQWLSNAAAKGFTTIGPTSTPPVGSVAVWNTGQFGHVAEVVGQLPGGGFQVSEENWLGTGLTDVRNVTGSALSGLQGFILPPGLKLPPFPGSQAGISAGQAAVSTGQGLAGIGSAIAGLPAAIGHGLANATTATTHNAAAWAKNWIVPLLVALVVAIVLFGGQG